MQKQTEILTRESCKDLSARNGFIAVFAVALFVLILKLLLSYACYGTNDITYWKFFSNVITQYGTFKIYSLVEFYNHPPLISWILKLIRYITLKSGFSFQFVFRLMPITADFLSIFVIWKLLAPLKVKTRTALCIICSLNPINFLISGFHGNTDPIFIFFVLFAIYLIKLKRIFSSGLCYGLSLCIKIVPILLLPVFFFYFRTKKERVSFLAASAIIPLLVFCPYLIGNYHAVKQNIFDYSGLKGIWGIPHILREIFSNDSMNQASREFAYVIYRAYNASGKLLLLIMIGGFSKYFVGDKHMTLLEGCFLAFSIFLSITPGFGVQYLSWLSYFAVIVMPLWGVIYILVGGIFLFNVYAYWSGMVWPYYANSDVIGPWVGFNKTLDIILWSIVLIMLIKFMIKNKSLAK